MAYEADGLSSVWLAIGAIVVLLWMALWALRRARPNSAVWGARDCTILRSLPVGSRERILVVRIGGKQLVVGAGSAGLSFLCELDEPLAPLQPANLSFSGAIRQALEKWHRG